MAINLTTRLGLKKPDDLAAFRQDDFNDNMDLLDPLAGADVHVFHSLNQSIAAATMTPLAFDSERQDADLMHDPAANTRLTFKVAGVYMIVAQTRWQGSASGSYRRLRIRLDGVTYLGEDQGPPSASFNATQIVVCRRRVIVNQYVEAIVDHDAATSQNCEAFGDSSPEFWAVKVRP